MSVVGILQVMQGKLPFLARHISMLGFQLRTEAEIGRQQNQGYDLERPGIHQRLAGSHATVGREGTGSTYAENFR